MSAITQPNPSSDPPPPAIPDHELLRQVGQGSYGGVWLARSVVGTYRAVKIVHRKTFTHERPFEREFLGIQKFEPVSRTHPGLVSILHIGKSPDAFYYVMEIADDRRSGQNIDPAVYTPKTLGSEMQDRGTLPPAECLELGWRLTAALEHLHRHGLVHRDIKPSNIIFVSGVPKIADIGLVTRIGEASTFVGTAGYIPPEGPGSPLADLYSLGKVLYEIGLGKDREAFPELPTQLAEHGDTTQLMQLNEIVLKACAPDARQRFRSADEMHTALGALLDRGRNIPEAESAPIPSGRPLSNPTLRVVILNPSTNPLTLNLARRLADQLTASGLDVFLDEHADIGVAWARELESQIRDSDAAIALLSPDSMRNEMLAYEIEIAGQTSAANPHRLRLVAVRVQFPGVLPGAYGTALGRAVTFSWDGPRDDARLVKEIVRALVAGHTDVTRRRKAD